MSAVGVAEDRLLQDHAGPAPDDDPELGHGSQQDTDADQDVDADGDIGVDEEEGD
jgi:hypothetical protein